MVLSVHLTENSKPTQREILLVDPFLGYRAEFRVDSSCIISSPGKYEGEPCYVPYLWELVLHGYATEEEREQECEQEVWRVDIPEKCKKVWPRKLGNASSARLWLDDNGFVYCDIE